MMLIVLKCLTFLKLDRKYMSAVVFNGRHIWDKNRFLGSWRSVCFSQSLKFPVSTERSQRNKYFSELLGMYSMFVNESL